MVVVTGDAVLGLVWVVLFAYTMKRWTPERGRAAALEWADKRRVSCDEQWLDPVQRQLRTNVQADFVAMYFLFGVLVQVPASVKPYAACLVGLPAVVVIARGLTFSRMILPPGTRVARARELVLADYLPTRTRLLVWLAAACGLAACLSVAVVRDQWIVAVSGLLLLAPPIAIERAGARLVRMPEPADSAAHLYLQDAFRSDLLRFAAMRSPLAASALVGYLGIFLLDGNEGVAAILIVLGVCLFAVLMIDALDFRDDPAGHMRVRLWRALPHERVLGPQDPIPTRGAA